jgi:hypothetical protein
MRRLVLLTIVVLTATGLPVAFGWLPPPRPGWSKAIVLLHLWGGVFFLVIFPLYAWDHISANRRWLRRLAGVTVSGAVQALSGALLIGSGVLLLLYGDQVWQALRAWHHELTYPLLAALAVHYLSRKSG